MRLPEFDGNRANLRPWITQTTLILGTRGYRDWEELDKVAALLGSIKGEAARFMGPWVEKQELVGLTVLRFFAQLRSAFGDELTQQRALKELETLKQGKKPYQEFYTKFARLVSEAEGDDWPDATKNKFFCDALRPQVLSAIRLQARMAGGAFEDWERAARSFCVDDDALARPGYFRGGIQSPQTTTEAMEWEPTRKAGPQGTQAGRGEDKRRAKWVSPEEIQRRRAENLCTQCGGSGHWRNQCPHLPARRPGGAQGGTARSRAAHVVAPVLEEEQEKTTETSEN